MLDFGRRGFTRQPESQTCTVEGPGASNTTKIPRKDPKREKEERKLWREDGKSEKFWAPHLFFYTERNGTPVKIVHMLPPQSRSSQPNVAVVRLHLPTKRGVPVSPMCAPETQETCRRPSLLRTRGLHPTASSKPARPSSAGGGAVGLSPSSAEQKSARLWSTPVKRQQ